MRSMSASLAPSNTGVAIGTPRRSVSDISTSSLSFMPAISALSP